MRQVPLQLLVVAALFSTALPLAAQTTSKMVAGQGAAEVVTVKARVDSIDKATRRIGLTGPEGRSMSVVAGPDVRNFDQIVVGDTVMIKHLQALAVDLIKSPGSDGIREMVVREGVMVSPQGGMPGAMAGRETVVIANVWSVDKKRQMVTLRGARDGLKEFKVKDPAKLAAVQVGDQVELKFVEAVAVGVTRVTAK
jgi:Cu/Ag efflux protein CusF